MPSSVACKLEAKNLSIQTQQQKLNPLCASQHNFGVIKIPWSS